MATEKFHQLGSMMQQNFEQENYEASKELAKEYLELAQLKNENWNYGNAIHQSNLILGKIALKEGLIEEAKNYLIEAGKTPGSPQLKSFGPNMSLAKELLELGEQAVVIEYIELCEKFWKKAFSEAKVKKWRKEIDNGNIPDFKANLNY